MKAYATAPRARIFTQKTRNAEVSAVVSTAYK